MSISLSPQQDVAVRSFAEWIKPFLGEQRRYFHDTPEGGEEAWTSARDDAPVYLQQGYAGTGKSTILPFMVEASGLKPEEVAFLAPTGKASKVMTAKLRQQGILQPATTVHRAIYRPKMMKAEMLEGELEALGNLARGASSQEERNDLQRQMKLIQRDLDRAYLSDSPSFQLNPDSSALRKARLIVVDEASMVGEGMADDLRSFGKPILAIGDPGQLQPVGDLPGFFFRKPENLLSEIHRQAADNPIIWASKIIREGGLLDYGVHGGALRIIPPEKDDATYDLDRDAQIICGTNNKRWRTTREIRRRSGLHAQGPVAGEMMICVKNSRVYPDVVNGTMLQVTSDTGLLNEGDVTCYVSVKDEDGRAYTFNCVQAILEENYLGKGGATVSPNLIFHAKKDEKIHQIDWGYVITAHKSQGSQWNDVVVHDESSMFRDQAKEWLYTAVTRAAETLTLVM